MARTPEQAAKPPQPASPSPAIPPDIAALSFEQAVDELEQIIDRIESGKIGLEQSLAQYERGVALREHCRAILAKAEQRVTELTIPEPPSA